MVVFGEQALTSHKDPERSAPYDAFPSTHSIDLRTPPSSLCTGHCMACPVIAKERLFIFPDLRRWALRAEPEYSGPSALSVMWLAVDFGEVSSRESQNVGSRVMSG